MIAYLTEAPAGFVIAVAATLFIICLFSLWRRRARLSSCGKFIASGAVLLSGVAVAVLFLPISYAGDSCGMAAAALSLFKVGPVCSSVLTTIFDSASWLALAALAALCVSFAPSLTRRTEPVHS